VSSIDEIDWTTATGCEKSETGHGGVFFVKLPQGVVVLKTCADMASQLFASTITSWIGLRSAKVRLLDTHTDEFRSLYTRMKRIFPLAANKLSRRAYVLVQEFIPGTALKHVHHVDLEKWIRGKAAAPAPGSGAEGSALSNSSSLMKQSCYAMGHLSALDALFYYDGDRLPIVTQTKGNGGNIILSPDEFKICAIDNGANFINNDRRAKIYFEECRKVFRQFLSSPNTPAKQMEMVRTMMLRYTGWRVPDEEFLLPIQRGFLSGAKEIVEEFGDNSRIQRLLVIMQKVDPPIPGLGSLNLRFISSMLDLFRSALSEGKENSFSNSSDSSSGANANDDNDELASKPSATTDVANHKNEAELKKADGKGGGASGVRETTTTATTTTTTNHPPPNASPPPMRAALSEGASPANPIEGYDWGGGGIPPPPKLNLLKSYPPTIAKKTEEEDAKEKKEKSEQDQRRAAHALRTLNMISLQRVVLMAPSS